MGRRCAELSREQDGVAISPRRMPVSRTHGHAQAAVVASGGGYAAREADRQAGLGRVLLVSVRLRWPPAWLPGSEDAQSIRSVSVQRRTMPILGGKLTARVVREGYNLTPVWAEPFVTFIKSQFCATRRDRHALPTHHAALAREAVAGESL